MKTLPVVIVEAPSQADRVQRLIQYCYDLDGTRVEVIHDEKATSLPYPHCNNAALKVAARVFKGKSFIWLEPDAIPLKAGWAKALTDEWEAVRNSIEFLLSPDKNPPLDMIGGIGVYGPNTHWLIPDKIKDTGWDGWMIRHLGPLIGRTSLIQHSYGVYKDRQATPHRFPRDQHIIRPDAVIFHRDRYQDLITKLTPNRFLHSGDLGDIIAALPVIRQLGGGELIITDNEQPEGQRPRGKMKGERFEAIKPLLERQQYIYSVAYDVKPNNISHDFSTFRSIPRFGNLSQWQAKHLGVDDLDMSPWLMVDAVAHPHVIVARSERYHNPDFPWAAIVKKFKDRLMFVGTEQEHYNFGTEFKVELPRALTKDLLQVAQVIAGSSLGFYNQSCPFWIAAGMGRKLVQETTTLWPNSIVERPNAYYTENPLGIWRITSGLALAK